MFKKTLLGAVILMVVLVSGLSAADKSHYYSYIVKDRYMDKICFEPVNIDSTWESALYNAVNKYNNELSWISKINFVFNYTTENYCSYRVKVMSEKNTSYYANYLAVTKGCHKYLKKPCDSITINLANTYKLAYSTEKTALLMHEMGHVIGLKHTGSGEGIKVPNTYNDTDYYKSLYRAGGIEDNYSGSNEMSPEFTEYDIKSLLYLY